MQEGSPQHPEIPRVPGNHCPRFEGSDALVPTSPEVALPSPASECYVGNVATTGAEVVLAPEGHEMMTFVDLLIVSMPTPNIYPRLHLLRLAFPGIEVSMETSKRFWRAMESHPAVYTTGAEYSHKIIPPHLGSDVANQFWAMDEAVEKIIDHFFDRYLEDHFPFSCMIDYASGLEDWPAEESERGLFEKLLRHHPRTKKIEGGIVHVTAPGPKLYRNESLSIAKRVDLLFRTRREAVVANERWLAHKIFGKGDLYTDEELLVLREAVEQDARFVPIGNYPAWEIVPRDGTREELVAARQMVDTVIRTLESRGRTERLRIGALVEVAKVFGYDKQDRRLGTMLVMYFHAHPRLKPQGNLFAIQAADNP